MEINNFSDKVFLITGGTSGIGLGITNHLSSKGAFVYVCDYKDEKCKFESNNVKFILCDISYDSQVENMVLQISKEKGKLDCVINNAGILTADLTATQRRIHDSDLFKKTFEVNVYGCFNVSRYASKLMIENSSQDSECNGNIIHIASIAGYEAQRGQISYGMSKAALIAMTLPMARDLGKYKIRVNSIAPGIIDTPMSQGFKGSELGQRIIDNTPLRTIGNPINIAKLVELILLNHFINGEVIRIDGGVRVPQF